MHKKILKYKELHKKDFEVGDKLPQDFLKEIPRERVICNLSSNVPIKSITLHGVIGDRAVIKTKEYNNVIYYLVSGTGDIWFTNFKIDFNRKIQNELGL